MSEAVIASIDTGADISADTGAGGTGGAAADQASVSTDVGAGADGKGAADAGTTTAVSGADGQSAAGNATQDGKLVPLAALHEQRELVKALKTQITALEAQPKLSADDLQLLRELKEQKIAAAAPKDPDFLEDPKGYVDTKLTKAQEALQKLDEANEKRSQQERNQQEVSQLVSTVAGKEQEFLKTTPDYYDAVTHIRTVRASQLQMLHPQATPEQITRQIAIEEIGAARQLLQTGGDPADFAYRYAKTMGYVPKAQAAASGNGQAATTKTDKDAVRSMGGGGGADSTDDSEDSRHIPEFASALAERFSKGKRK